MTGTLTAEHGVVCRLHPDRFSYFGWPSIARTDSGMLAVVSSGKRVGHVCPWGRTTLHLSKDDGRTWAAPQVIQDSMIDDRDAGIASLGGERLLVTWFRSDTRIYAGADWLKGDDRLAWETTFRSWSEERVAKLLGSWTQRSDDGGATWGVPVRAPVSAPHGPIRLRNGHLLYLGKPYGSWEDMEQAAIQAAYSTNDGRTWSRRGSVPVFPGTHPANYHEPHVVVMPSGRLIGMIRVESNSHADLTRVGVPAFSMMQTVSDDGGRHWTEAKPLGFHGSPPHLLRHSSGVLILTYGYRMAPYGQRVAFSTDEGATWMHDWVLRDDGPDGDLGYPATVELGDGSLISVYYQKAARGEKCSLLWSRWQLPRL